MQMNRDAVRSNFPASRMESQTSANSGNPAIKRRVRKKPYLSRRKKAEIAARKRDETPPEYRNPAADLEEELRLLKLSLLESEDDEPPHAPEKLPPTLETQNSGSTYYDETEPFCLVKPSGAIHIYDPVTGILSDDVSPLSSNIPESPFGPAPIEPESPVQHQYAPPGPYPQSMWMNQSMPYYGMPNHPPPPPPYPPYNYMQCPPPCYPPHAQFNGMMPYQEPYVEGDVGLSCNQGIPTELLSKLTPGRELDSLVELLPSSTIIGAINTLLPTLMPPVY
ncbi:hypothetical protein BSKO_05232 [Bryopsis sp. KO-2023]|nr:hypothetical protein BSKO_05232 [Bryopsis sp. KO-2023]